MVQNFKVALNNGLIKETHGPTINLSPIGKHCQLQISVNHKFCDTGKAKFEVINFVHEFLAILLGNCLLKVDEEPKTLSNKTFSAAAIDTKTSSFYIIVVH